MDNIRPDRTSRAIAVAFMASSTIAATLAFGIYGLIGVWLIIAWALLRRP